MDPAARRAPPPTSRTSRQGAGRALGRRPQPVRIGVVNGKGGVGKTTLAFILATYLALRGKRVIVHDSDNDGSASAWAANAQQQGTPLPFVVANSHNLARYLSEEDHDFIITDTPANTPPVITALAAEADYLLVPVQPGSLEVDRMNLTLRAIRGSPQIKPGLLIGFVFNSRVHTRISRETEEYITGLDFPIIGRVSRRVGYQEAFGSPLSADLASPAAEILEGLGLTV